MARSTKPGPHRGPLSPMERAVAMQHAGGVTMRLNAEVLGISHETARTYLKRAVEKLGAWGGRVDLVRSLADAYRDPA